MSRPANFCPECGDKFAWKEHHGRSRPICQACGFVYYFDPKVAVLGVIIQDEKVLLVKRAFDPGKDKWACPAGFVEHDESPEEAVLRELQEETGLIGRVDRLLEVFPRRDHGLADIVICYQVSLMGGKMQAADDALDVQWFGRDELPELVFYPSITLIGERWRNYQF